MIEKRADEPRLHSFSICCTLSLSLSLLMSLDSWLTHINGLNNYQLILSLQVRKEVVFSSGLHLRDAKRGTLYHSDHDADRCQIIPAGLDQMTLTSEPNNSLYTTNSNQKGGLIPSLKYGPTRIQRPLSLSSSHNGADGSSYTSLMDQKLMRSQSSFSLKGSDISANSLSAYFESFSSINGFNDDHQNKCINYPFSSREERRHVQYAQWTSRMLNFHLIQTCPQLLLRNLDCFNYYNSPLFK